MKTAIFTLILATLVALSYSLPQGGEPKKIVVVGLGKGPWATGSQQVATWWATGFSADEPVTVDTVAEGTTTPIFTADSTVNGGSIQIPITDQYTPGTNYVTEVTLKSDPSIKGTGPVFTVTGGGGGGSSPAAAEPAPGGGPPSDSGPPPPPPGGPGGPPSDSGPPPPPPGGPGGPPSDSGPPPPPPGGPGGPPSDSGPPPPPPGGPGGPPSDSGPPPPPPSGPPAKK